MSEVKGRLDRRNFLLAVGAGGAATVAAAVATTAGKVPSQSKLSGSGKRATRGYAASEHINNYYRTTKV